MGSQILDLQFEVGLRPLGRALEGHVLKEVGHAVVLGGFISAKPKEGFGNILK